VASGVDAQLSTCSHVLDLCAEAVVQTVACGNATLPQQEKGAQQICRRTEQILPASSAQRQGASHGDVLSKSWGLGRSLTAQTTAQTAQPHVLAVVALPAPAAQISNEASAWPPASTLRHYLVRLVTRTF
jgi:hypothetical protein